MFSGDVKTDLDREVILQGAVVVHLSPHRLHLLQNRRLSEQEEGGRTSAKMTAACSKNK